MNKYILLSLILLGLSACATTQPEVDRTPKTTVEVITTTAYPEFPDLPIPPSPRLLKFDVDLPRRTSEVTVKNITTCINVAEEERDERFWARCGENPIDTTSNIFVGLDQQNWNNLNSNFVILQENNAIMRRLLEQANRQRSDWRNRAAQERDRTDQERARLTAQNTE